MLSDLRRAIPGFVAAVAAAIFSLLSYPRLPERVPIHWGITLEADRWASPITAAVLLPAFTLLLPFLMLGLVRIDPRGENYPRNRDTVWRMVNILTVSLAAIQVVIMAAGLGYESGKVIPLVIGFLFIALGNYTARLKRNWWIGIRTPWTLSSEEVWRRTHRLGAKTLVAAGVLMVLGSLLPLSMQIAVIGTALIVGALVPIVYSYLIWRGGQKTSEG